MPSKSPAQHRLMEAAAHTKGGFGGVPQKVGKEFVKADKMKKGGVAQSLKKAGFYEEGKSKSERLDIINDATTKPQRVQIVEKLFSAKKMKTGGSAKQAATAISMKKHNIKPKKMADGGISGLGDMVGNRPPDTPTFGDGGKDYGGGGGGSATDGLSTVNRGAQNIGSALSRASAAIGGGGGTGGGGDITTPTMPYKKGGHVTTRRMSTCSPSKKSPNW